MNGIPSTSCQNAMALAFVDPTMVMWWAPWTWIFFTGAAPVAGAEARLVSGRAEALRYMCRAGLKACATCVGQG